MSLRTHRSTVLPLLGGFVIAYGLALVSPSAARARVTFSNTARLSVEVGSDGTQAIALADVNKDNRPDIIAVSQFIDEVNVVLNDGNGGFGAAPNPFNVGAGPVAVGTGDFDRDGNLDIVTVNSDSNTVTILFGDGTGTFNVARQDYPVGVAPVGLAVADYNNDLKPDLAVLSDSTVYLLMSNGDRTFTPFNPASIATRSTGGTAITVGLLNADSFPDLAISNIDSDDVSVFIGNGNGTFKAAKLYNTGSAPDGIVIGDWDGDGKQDIAVVDSEEIADLNVSLLFGNGDGTFQNDMRTTAQTDSIAIAAADLDGNGRLDFAVTNLSQDSTVAVLLYDPSAPNAEAGFSLQELVRGLSFGRSQVAVQAADLNNDGRPDLIALGEDTATLGVFINTTGSATPTPTTTPTAPPQPSSSATPTPNVRISIGSAVGRPGDTVDITVSLASSGAVAATGNDIVVGSSILTLDGEVGCRVNPAIGKSLIVSSSMDEFLTATRVFVGTSQHTDPIPDGPLYTCTFRVAPSALPDGYVLANENARAFTPAGTQLDDVAGVSGIVIVSLLPTPQASHTPTPGPTSTAAPLPSSGGGCTIAQASGATIDPLVLLSLLPLALRRRRTRAGTEA